MACTGGFLVECQQARDLSCGSLRMASPHKLALSDLLSHSSVDDRDATYLCFGKSRC
jgi:hypothetical protein